MDTINKYYKKSPITTITIGICVIVYLITLMFYGIEMNAYEALNFGAYNPMYVSYNHEYYRLLTANFIHFGILHLVVNCYSLLGLGTFLETILSKKKYIIVLIVSGLATTGLPYLLFLFNGFEANTVSGGISGVIFGLIGALGALALLYKDIFLRIFKQLLPNILVMLVISFTIPSISWSGHVFGMIGGFVSTYIILYININKSKRDHLVH